MPEPIAPSCLSPRLSSEAEPPLSCEPTSPLNGSPDVLRCFKGSLGPLTLGFCDEL